MNDHRVPAGSPEGGQWAAGTNPEPDDTGMDDALVRADTRDVNAREAISRFGDEGQRDAMLDALEDDKLSSETIAAIDAGPQGDEDFDGYYDRIGKSIAADASS